MALPHVNAGEVARAAEQNDLIDTVNSHTGSITSASNIIGDHATRIAAVEARASGTNAGAYFGQWIDNNDKSGQTISGSVGVKLTPWTVAIGTPTGCSMSGGTLTVAQAGLWQVSVSVQYGAGTSLRALWLSNSAAASGSGLAKVGSVAGPSMDVQTATGMFRLSAGGVVSAYSAIWQGGADMAIYRALSNSLTAAWLGP